MCLLASKRPAGNSLVFPTPSLQASGKTLVRTHRDSPGDGDSKAAEFVPTLWPSPSSTTRRFGDLFLVGPAGLAATSAGAASKAACCGGSSIANEHEAAESAHEHEAATTSTVLFIRITISNLSPSNLAQFLKGPQSIFQRWPLLPGTPARQR